MTTNHVKNGEEDVEHDFGLFKFNLAAFWDCCVSL